MKTLALVILLATAGIATAGGAADGSDAPAPAATPDVAAKKQACAEAMNADPEFAKSILRTIDKQIDEKTIEAHQDAFVRIQKNERHVILAYAALWVIAALLVAFLFFRQQALKAEIATLRRDLKVSEDKS